MSTVVHALAPLLAAQGAEGGSIMPLLFTGLMFVALYWLMIRPQSKQQKEHQEFLSTLKKGQDVVTYGGLMGKVHQVGADSVTVEIARDVRVQVMKNMVYAQAKAAPVEEKAEAKADQKSEEKAPAGK